MSHRCRHCSKSFRKSDHLRQHEEAAHGAILQREAIAARNRHQRERNLRMMAEMGMPAEALAAPLMLGSLLRRRP